MLCSQLVIDYSLTSSNCCCMYVVFSEFVSRDHLTKIQKVIQCV